MHGLHLFKQTNLRCYLLEENHTYSRSIMRWALTAAIVTAYARPFKQRPEVKLIDDVIPTEFRPLHDEAIVQRDKVIAHRDLDGPVATWGFVTRQDCREIRHRGNSYRDPGVRLWRTTGLTDAPAFLVVSGGNG